MVDINDEDRFKMVAFRMPIELWKGVKMLCAEKEITMVDFLKDLIRRALKEAGF